MYIRYLSEQRYLRLLRGEVASPQSGWSSEPGSTGAKQQTSPDVAAMSDRTFVAHVSGIKPSDLRCWGRGASAERKRSGRGEERAFWMGLERDVCALAWPRSDGMHGELHLLWRGFLANVPTWGRRKDKGGPDKGKKSRLTSVHTRSLGSFVCACVLSSLSDAVFVFMLTMDKDKVVWTLIPVQSGRGVALIIALKTTTTKNNRSGVSLIRVGKALEDLPPQFKEFNQFNTFK